MFYVSTMHTGSTIFCLDNYHRPICRQIGYLRVLLFLVDLLCIMFNALKWSSSELNIIGDLFILGSRLLIDLLSSMAARLGSLSSIGIDLICKRVMFTWC